MAPDPPRLVAAPPMLAHREQFMEDGFIIVEQLITPALCASLNARLEALLRGEYDVSGGRPDKAPKLLEQRCKPGKSPPPLGGPSKTTLQLINVWKADRLFRALVTSADLSHAVATLGGWAAGARVANDQVWAKPPGAAALTFHRDSAYFDFVPADVITVWIALDDMAAELGPLEYVRGSHRWAQGRVGSASQFFDSKDRHALLYDAARREGIAEPEKALEVVQVAVRAGGCGIHNGRLWHGSDRNASTSRPRRGLGIHFVPADAEFREPHGYTLAHRLQQNVLGNSVAQRKLVDELFPITYSSLPRETDSPLEDTSNDTVSSGRTLDNMLNS
ncbi:hypothetical protein AB1Y20_019215 [Prymnesium parvum]|uniref:Phytanoyl-CoA dioxygenase n=1 Tax=Prymnesium parvum TaxID=97485 RepID=A0AB34JRU6_PRYPA